MIVTEFLEQHEDGTIFYRRYSNTPGKALLQVETGYIYGEVAIADTDPYTYEEVDDPEQPVEDEVTLDDALAMLRELGVDV